MDSHRSYNESSSYSGDVSQGSRKTLSVTERKQTPSVEVSIQLSSTLQPRVNNDYIDEYYERKQTLESGALMKDVALAFLHYQQNAECASLRVYTELNQPCGKG